MCGGAGGGGVCARALSIVSMDKILRSTILLFFKQHPQRPRGAGIAQWLERRTRDRKVSGSSPGRSGGRIFLLQGQLSLLTRIWQ